MNRDQYKLDNPHRQTSANRGTPVNPQNQPKNPGSRSSKAQPLTTQPKNQVNNPRYNTRSDNRNARPSQQGTVRTSAGEQVIKHDTLHSALNHDRTVC